MKTSNEINEIAKALSLAQSEMSGATKQSTNPFYKSNYSDLASVMQAISLPFSAHGLCFVQGAEANEQRVSVTTRIIHTSGQWLEATTELPPTKADAQGWGSAITYAKRYGLQALCGVPSVDDDGQEAVKRVAAPKATPINKKQAEEINLLIEDTGTDKVEFLNYYSTRAGSKITDLNQFPKDLFEQAVAVLNKKSEAA
tara:strand:- start:374 stop:970 length:597 start_codon:yes stop_codon:yes gene_type:complete